MERKEKKKKNEKKIIKIHPEEKPVIQVCGESKVGLYHQQMNNSSNPMMLSTFGSEFTLLFSQPFHPNVHAHNEKGKLRYFLPILDFKLICF